MLKSFATASFIAISTSSLATIEENDFSRNTQISINYPMVVTSRTLMALPFDLFGTGKQIYPHKTYPEIITEFCTRNTLKKVVWPYTFGSGMQSSYIYPLASIVPKTIEENFPEPSKTFPIFPKLCLATIISGINTILVTPVEGIKVWTMTEGINSPHLLPFYKREEGKIRLNRNTLSRDWLFKGGSLTFQSSWLHITSFLVLQHYVTDFVHQDKTRPFTIYDACKVGAVISTFQSLITYPLMTLRTQLQSAMFQGDRKTKGIMGIIKAANLTKIVELYSGLGMRLIRNAFMVPFDVYVLGNIDRARQQK